MGVQRAEPIDLSAGNEPFHINGGRGDRTQAQVFLVVCGCVAVAAGALSFCLTHDSDSMVNVSG